MNNNKIFGLNMSPWQQDDNHCEAFFTDDNGNLFGYVDINCNNANKHLVMFDHTLLVTIKSNFGLDLETLYESKQKLDSGSIKEIKNNIMIFLIKLDKLKAFT